jgi:FKBP-type peptidyl-prolyl cis-trans isomerase
VRTASGLEFLDVAPGEGPTGRTGAKVRVRCTTWLPEGTLVEDGACREFVLGDGTQVAGLEEGLMGLGAGARRRLIVPSDLAYGPKGLPPAVPPYATLIVDVEVLLVGRGDAAHLG